MKVDDLARFEQAQDKIYSKVVLELKKGKKESHWMWFIFPQIAGLGTSTTARLYAIQDIEEARAYLAHPILGHRLKTCSQYLLSLNGLTAFQIFSSPDDLKLKSSMTLFALISEPNSIFHQVLEKYYYNLSDEKTIALLKQ